MLTLISIRYITADDYGLKALSDVVFSLLFILAASGFSSFLVQQKSLMLRDIEHVFALLISLNFSLGLLQILLAGLVASYYQDIRVQDLILVLAIIFFIIPFISIPEKLLERDLKFKKISIIYVVSNVFTGVTTLCLAILEFGVWALVFGQLVSFIVRLILFNMSVKWFCHPRFHSSINTSIMKFGGAVWISSLLWALANRTDIFIAGSYFDSNLIGYYALAVYIASLPMEKIMPILQQVAFPGYSKLQNDRILAAKYFKKSLRLTSFVLMPLLFGLSVIAEDFIPLMLGEKWNEAVPFLVILSLIYPFRALGALFAPVFFAFNAAEQHILNMLFFLIVMSVAMLVGVNWGLQGISYAWVIAYPIVLVFMGYKLKSLLPVTLLALVKQIALPFVASIIMWLCVYELQLVLADNSLVLVGLQICFGFFVYLAVIWLCDRKYTKEFINIIRKA